MSKIGTCTECGTENVKVISFDDGACLCEECIDSLYEKCDICDEYFEPEYVEFFVHKDGRMICEYCAENFDADDFEDEE